MRTVTGTLSNYEASKELQNNRPENTARSSETCFLCRGRLERRETELFDTRFGIKGTYEVRRCHECGLEQLFPIPELTSLKTLYESHYNFGGEKGTLYTRLRERFLFSFLCRCWTRLDGDISFYLRRGSGRLLDIGCNEGRGLRIYAANGFQVEGLELNETAAFVARRAGFNVYTELLEKFHSQCPYDVAVLSNVLEHSLNPRQMLLDVNRLLTNRGQIWISCPNSQSWLRTIFRKSWINWHVPFHISYFETETLGRLLIDAGYVDVEVRQITPALWVAQSVIARLFSKEGKKTGHLRNPFLILLLVTLVRSIFFPVLWVVNKLGHGDCLLAIGTKG